MLAVLPSHGPMTVSRGNHLKRPRGSSSCNQKAGQYPRERAEERNLSVVAPKDPRSTQRPSAANRQSQSCLVSHRRPKRRRFSADSPGALQNTLPVALNTKPVLPTPSPPLPSSSSQPDEEDGLSVITERLRLKMTNSSSTAAHGRHPTGQVCTYEDWQDIKELFAKAAEQYNGKLVPNISNPPATIRSSRHFLYPAVAPPDTDQFHEKKNNSSRNGCCRGDAVATCCDS